MNVIDMSYFYHKPIKIMSNIPENIFDDRKPIIEYFCPECNKQLKYKQKHCNCGHWIWWKVKKTEEGMIGPVE